MHQQPQNPLSATAPPPAYTPAYSPITPPACRPCVKCGAMDRYDSGGCRACQQKYAIAKSTARGPKKPMFGVAHYAAGKYASRSDGKQTKEYAQWRAMIARCYDEKCQVANPSYVGCTVSEGFRDFQKFMLWAEKQVGFGVKGFQLDKDILVAGGKEYSESTCVFVPREVNNLLISRGTMRGACPVGVSVFRGGYSASLSRGLARSVWLGTFHTKEAAFNCYKLAKELHIRTVAETYRHAIDPRAYHALMAWTISIDD